MSIVVDVDCFSVEEELLASESIDNDSEVTAVSNEELLCRVSFRSSSIRVQPVSEKERKINKGKK